MPLFSSKLELTSAASGSGIALADVQYIRGAFRTVADTGELNNIPVTQVQDGQIVWVESASTTYQATVTLADYINTFSDSVSWSTFSGFGSSGGSSVSNLGDLGDVYTGSLSNGQVLQWNSSLNRWQPATVAGTGDITAVYAGAGLDGSGESGDITLSVNAGLGISVNNDRVSLNTGSAHFTDAVNALVTSGVGDITAVFAGAGLSGTAESGDALLAVNAGLGISVHSDAVNLDTGSAHFINALAAIATAGIFKATGSYYSTTNDLQVTGSLTLQYNGSGTPFKIDSGSTEVFSVSGEGILQIVSQSGIPTPVAGGIYRGNDNNIYIGI